MRKLSGYGPSLIVLATAMVVLFLGPSAVQRLTYKQTEARMVQASHRLTQNSLLADLNQAYRDVALFVEPSVVHINAQQTLPERRGLSSLSSGSGWVYDETGHIVTNYHVVRDAERIEIQLASGELRSADVVGYDRSTDIAVLKTAPGELHAAVLRDDDDPVQQGDMIFAFGSPFDFRFSMSAGIVSGKGRHVDVLGRAGYENFIQVDAAINPGNSGGPLTDYLGRVIGMNTAIATGRRSSLEEGQFAGIGLAIPLEMIEPVVSQIINNNGVVEKGLLGVIPGTLNLREAQRLGFIGTGVLIVEVHPEFPAARAGVQPRDIVTAVNGNRIDGPSQLRSIVSSMLPGETARLSIWRPNDGDEGGSELTLPVELVRLDQLRDTGVLPDDQSLRGVAQIGLPRIATATEDLARRYGASFVPGVIVEETTPGSSASEIIQRGGTIVAVRGTAVADVEEFYAALRRENLRGRGVAVTVVQPDGVVQDAMLRVLP